MKKILFVILFTSFTLIAQDSSSLISDSDSSININDYTMIFNDDLLTVKDNNGEVVYSRNFNNSTFFISDLDDDSSDEVIVIDNLIKNNINNYNVFVYSTSDDFILADSISSGSSEPTLLESDELGAFVIEAGNINFEQYNTGIEKSLPLSFYKYEDYELLLVDDEIYQNYISENEELTGFIDDYILENGSNCQSLAKVKNLIVSVYVNFINAEELSLANQFLKKYYSCPDYSKLKSDIDKFFFNLD